MGLTSHLSDAYDGFLLFFFFALQSDEDVSDESENERSGSGFTSVLCIYSCFEVSIDRVS